MSVQSKKGPIYEIGTCRCCGARKKCRLLNIEYEHLQKKEIYSDMFVECFGLVLSHLDGEETERLVCAVCVVRLREASQFRQQVLKCEEEFLKTHIQVHGDGSCGLPPMVIKTEVIIKEEAEDMLSDDFNDIEIINNPIPEAEVQERTLDKPTKTPPAKTPADKPKSSPKQDHNMHKEQLFLRMMKTKETLRRLQKSRETLKMLQKTKEMLMKTKKTKESMEKLQNAKHTLQMMEMTKEMLMNTQTNTDSLTITLEPETPPEPLEPPLSEYADEDARSIHNSVTIVENSYVCPFKTSYSTYHCIYCKASFHDPANLREHNLIHDPKYFDKIYHFKKATYLDILRIDCRLCDAKITDLEVFKTHIKEKHGKKLYDIKDGLLTFRLHSGPSACTVCGESFMFFHVLKRHMAEHFGSFVCDVCAAHYFNKKTLEIHIKNTHVQDFKYTCHECGRMFKKKHDLPRHLSMVHKKEAAYQCSKCDVSLFTSRERRKHMKDVHGESQKFTCETCGRVYMNRKNLLEHIRVSHLRLQIVGLSPAHAASRQARNEKSYDCDICGKTYPRLHYLKLHIQSHNTATSS